MPRCMWASHLNASLVCEFIDIHTCTMYTVHVYVHMLCNDDLLAKTQYEKDSVFT